MYDSRNEEVLNSMEIRRVGFMLSNSHSIIRASLWIVEIKRKGVFADADCFAKVIHY
jgi:hypothetical protein